MDTKEPIEESASQSVEENAANPDTAEEAGAPGQPAEQPVEPDPRATARRRWMRHPRKKVFGGVCGGMADYLSVSEGIVRLIWLGLIVFSIGSALPLYILFWLFLPVGTSEEGITAPATASLKAKHGVWVAWGLIAVGIVLLASNLGIFDFLISVGSMTIGPILLIAIGFYALKKFRNRSNGETMRDQVADLGAARQKVGAKLHRFSGLSRSRKDRVLFGVCGGLGQSLGVDPVLIRIGFVLLGFATAFVGMGFFYLLLAIVIPVEDNVEVPASTESASVSPDTSLEGLTDRLRAGA